LATAVASGARVQYQPIPKCPPPHHAHILLANPQAVVYEGPDTVGLFGRESKGLPNIYGCTARGRRAFYLGGAASFGSQGGGGIEGEALGGTFVAYENVSVTTSEIPHPGSYEVIVRDLHNGRFVRRLPTGPRPVNPANTSFRYGFGVGPTRAIVVKNDGAVAWMVEDYSRLVGGHTVYDVYAADRSGTRLLAFGEDVDRYSLALAGSDIYWTQGGNPFTAPLN